MLGLTLAAGGPASARQSSEVESLVRQGQWPEALRAAERERDPTARGRGRVEVLYAAGDLGGALRAALEGLRIAPDDTVLAWRQTQIALTLGLSDLGQHGLQRLERSIETPAIGPEAKEFWEAQVRDLRRQEGEIAAREAERRRALQRAQVSVVAGLLAILLALVWLARAS